MARKSRAQKGKHLDYVCCATSKLVREMMTVLSDPASYGKFQRLGRLMEDDDVAHDSVRQRVNTASSHALDSTSAKQLSKIVCQTRDDDQAGKLHDEGEG